MPESEYRHEPFTDKILAGAGGTFALGLVTGSAVCFLKGTYDSSYGQRFISGTQVVRMNAPWFAGQCAVYSCLFDTFEYTLISLRQKQDVWNEIVAGTASYGCMGIFHGLREATRMALFGGVVVATLRGAKFIWRKKQQQMVSIEDDDRLTFIRGHARSTQEISQSSASHSPSSWLGGLFHGSKKGHDK